MRRMMAGSVRQVLMCGMVLIALASAGAGWAVQSERGTPERQTPERQTKERPILLACTGDQQSKWNFCLTERRAACATVVGERQRQACVEGINASCSSALGVQC